MEQFLLPKLKERMHGPHRNTRSLIFPSGWTRCQLHQTELDLNIVLTHREIGTSDQYTVTVAYQELIYNSVRYLNFRLRGKYTFLPYRILEQSQIIRQRRTDPKEGQHHASSQLWTHWRAEVVFSMSASSLYYSVSRYE